MKQLRGSVAVVTGGGSGIGAAIARALAKSGMKVVVADIEPEAAAETASSICASGGQAVAYRVDISDAKSVAELADHVQAVFGTCHLVCANAGVLLLGRLDQRSVQDWEWVFSVNVMGTVHTVQALLPMLKEHPGNAHVVITASMAGLLAAAPGKGVYNASKHALMAYGETLREELLEDGVGVSLLLPGGVKSRIVQSGRNRPRELGESTVTEAAIQMVIRGTGDNEAVEPDYAVRNLISGIEQNQPWIITHDSQQRVKIEQRFAGIISAFDLAREVTASSPGVASKKRMSSRDPVIVITGAGGGMGLACARSMANRGILLLADLDENRLGQAVALLRQSNAEVQGLHCDLADAGAAPALMEAVAANGRLAALVHTAGVSPAMADWRRVLEVDLIATARLLKAALPLAESGAAAVCLASIAGHMQDADAAMVALLNEPLADGFFDRLVKVLGRQPQPSDAYMLAKRGVIQLCERAAVPWGSQGARVVSLSPGLIDTPMGRLELEHQPAKRKLAELTPIKGGGRSLLPGRSEEIAAVVAFLCSEAASFVTGCDIRVDGGLIAALRHRHPAASATSAN